MTRRKDAGATPVRRVTREMVIRSAVARGELLTGRQRWPTKRPVDVSRVLVSASKEPLEREALIRKAVRPLRVALEATCLWSEDGRDWQIGDFNFLVVEFSAAPGVPLFVQWWSEPLEPVAAEICAGKWTPAARPFITPAVRRRVRALGYVMTPASPNYRKSVQIASAEDAERVAREAIEFFHDAWGWRGTAPLRARIGRDRRSRTEFVHDSLTPEDVAKTFAVLGLPSEVRKGEDGRPFLLVRGDWPAVVHLPWQVPDQNLFAALHFETTERSPLPPSPGLANLINDGLLFGKTHVDDDGELAVTMDVRVDGGVTATWLQRCVEQWGQVRREVRERLQHASGTAASLAAASLVHERGPLAE